MKAAIISYVLGLVYPVIDKDKCIDFCLYRKVRGYGKTKLLRQEKQRVMVA